jgi:predicted transcriptional regulator
MRDRILMSKTGFAEWIGVGQSAVSNYIALGQISAGSIEGEGRYAKIAVNSAVRDLRKNLDVEGSQAVNRRARLRLYRRSSATTGLSKEEEAQCVAQIEDAMSTWPRPS